MKLNFFHYVSILFLSLGIVSPVLAYVASSTNFLLERDSINFVGEEDASSTNFGLRDTGGELGTGPSESASYNLEAGYRQLDSSVVATSLSLSTPADITLSEIDRDGGQSDGQAVWTVITNNTNGYRLSIKAGSSPALQSTGGNFSDYVPAGANPDYTWSVGQTSAMFGFSPSGVDLVDRFLDNGTSCNVGSSDSSNACWVGFSTSDITIAERNNPNNPTGSDSTINIRAEIGDSATVNTGTYSTTLTVTAITL